MTVSADGARVGLYGKVATQADFLRINAGEFVGAGLDRLFEDGVEALRKEGTSLPPTPVAFVLAPPGRSAFVGAFAPSRDAVGRSFPLAAFVSLPSHDLAGVWPAVPARLASFLQAAKSLVVASVEGQGDDLARQAEALSSAPPGPGVSASEPDWALESSEELRAALGGDAACAYALRTFATACDQALKAGPSAPGGIVTVDAPAPSVAARTFWLDLAQRRLAWRDAVPSLFWIDEPPGRLLLTLGTPIPTAFAFLANPRHRSPRFWPLKTEIAAAVERAREALTPTQRSCLENEQATLGELAAAFS